MDKCAQPVPRAASDPSTEVVATVGPPFEPPVWAAGPHLQTIIPNYIVGRDPAGPRLHARSEPEILDTGDGDRLRIFWSCHPSGGPDDARSVLVVLHGLTGCAAADNVMAVAAKGAHLGFDVVRVDLRNSQAEHPALGIGHAGRSEDLRTVLDHVAARRPDSEIAVIGFSLGGNIALKAVGEYGATAPQALGAVATISVPIDLDDACRAIDGPGNWIYRSYFLKRLGHRYEAVRARHPERFPPIDHDAIRGIRDWDNAVVAPLAGFVDADDYYERSSAEKVLAEIRVPTLVIHARDDPFIPFGPFERPPVRDNPHVALLAPEHGGHVGFWAASPDGHPDRYWAENRALAFCARRLGPSPAGTG